MHTNIMSLIETNAFSIGNISVETDSLVFNTPLMKSSGQVNRKAFIDMGDVVYFMVVNEVLKKIGKAAGQYGWYGRMQEYGKTRYNKSGKDCWDATTRKIYNHMIQNYEAANRKIEIYVIRTPKEKVTFTNPLTNDIMVEYIETAGTVEQSLIQLAYGQGYTLDFCREKEIKNA